MSNIHRDPEHRGLDDEDMWLGRPAPSQPPRWLTEGMATPDPNPFHPKETR